MPKLNHSFLSLVTVATPFPVVVMGTLDGHLQLFDLRMKDCAHWWRLNADITSKEYWNWTWSGFGMEISVCRMGSISAFPFPSALSPEPQVPLVKVGLVTIGQFTQP